MSAPLPIRRESIHWHGPYSCDNPEHVEAPTHADHSGTVDNRSRSERIRYEPEHRAEVTE